MNKAFVLALVALVAVGTACSSGSSDGGPIDPGSGISAGFIPDESDPGSDTVTANEGVTGGNLVTVDISVTDASGISGAAFDLTYDPSIASFQGLTEGNLFQQGVYEVGEPANGQLVVGVSREAGAPLGDATGTQKTIIGLTFEVFQAGESIVSFEAAELTDDQPLPLPIPDIDWSGGLLTGTE